LLSSFNFPPVRPFLQISGLGARKVTWNRFPIKNFQSIPLLTPIVESKHLKIAPLPRRPCYQGYNLTDVQERLRLRCVNSAFASGPVGRTWVAAIFGAIVMTQAEMTFQRNARAFWLRTKNASVSFSVVDPTFFSKWPKKIKSIGSQCLKTYSRSGWGKPALCMSRIS